MSDNGGVLNTLPVLPFVRAVSRGVTGITTGTNTSIYPLISLRALSGQQLTIDATLKSLSVLATVATVQFMTHLILAPTVAGTDAVSWTTLTGTGLQYDVTRNNTNTLTGGTVLHTWYATGGLLLDGIDTLKLPGDWAYTGAAQRELVLAAQLVDGTTARTFLASLNVAQWNN